MAPRQASSHPRLLWFLSVWPLALAAIIIWLPQRFTSRAWKFAFGMPGGYATWGGILLVVGLVMVVAMAWHTGRGYYLYIAGLIVVGLWWVALGIVFLYTALKDPLANPIGFLSWTPIGTFHWYWAHRIYKHRR